MGCFVVTYWWIRNVASFGAGVVDRVVDGPTAHISYVDASHDNLLYVDTMNKTPEVADDGYRPGEEKTLDGLDSPVWHLVGDSSSN